MARGRRTGAAAADTPAAHKATSDQGELFVTAAADAPMTLSPLMPSLTPPLTAPLTAPPGAPLSIPLGDAFARLPAAWRACLADFIAGPAYTPLCAFVDAERAQGKTIYPADPFRALTMMQAEQVKVVILGQDPYHGEDHGIPQAHGLAFSVPPGVRPPPSLRNICKEITAEFGFDPPPHGCLDGWAKQGVLLLNTSLTVEQDKAGSHAKKGWEACTDALIQHLADRPQGLVFMLWGAHAQAKRSLLTAHPQHRVLMAPHPSPLSAHRGFFGCGHFAEANAFLEQTGRATIDWRILPV